MCPPYFTLHIILIEFGITMKVCRLIKMCLNEIYSIVDLGTHLNEIYIDNYCVVWFLFRMVWNKEMLHHHCCFILLDLLSLLCRFKSRLSWDLCRNKVHKNVNCEMTMDLMSLILGWEFFRFQPKILKSMNKEVFLSPHFPWC
jgi:hypothetical protein